MTSRQKMTISQAIEETETALARAKRYMSEHQDVKLIAFYESHLLKLAAMLNLCQ